MTRFSPLLAAVLTAFLAGPAFASPVPQWPDEFRMTVKIVESIANEPDLIKTEFYQTDSDRQVRIPSLEFNDWKMYSTKSLNDWMGWIIMDVDAGQEYCAHDTLDEYLMNTFEVWGLNEASFAGVGGCLRGQECNVFESFEESDDGRYAITTVYYFTIGEGARPVGFSQVASFYDEHGQVTERRVKGTVIEFVAEVDEPAFVPPPLCTDGPAYISPTYTAHQAIWGHCKEEQGAPGEELCKGWEGEIYRDPWVGVYVRDVKFLDWDGDWKREWSRIAEYESEYLSFVETVDECEKDTWTKPLPHPYQWPSGVKYAALTPCPGLEDEQCVLWESQSSSEGEHPRWRMWFVDNAGPHRVMEYDSDGAAVARWDYGISPFAPNPANLHVIDECKNL